MSSYPTLLIYVWASVVLAGCLTGGSSPAGAPPVSETVVTTQPTATESRCDATGDMVRQPEYVTVTITGPSQAPVNDSVTLQVRVTARTEVEAVTGTTTPHLVFVGDNEPHRLGNLSPGDTVTWTTTVRPTTAFVGYVEVVVSGRFADRPIAFSQTVAHELAAGTTTPAAPTSEVPTAAVTRASPTAC